MLSKHILSRFCFVLLAPASLIAAALDAIIGIGAGIMTLSLFAISLPLRLLYAFGILLPIAVDCRPLFDLAFSHLFSFQNGLSSCQIAILSSINPYHGFLPTETPPKNLLIEDHTKRTGVLTGYVQEALYPSIDSLYASQNRFEKHVCSRALALFSTLALLVCRVVDAVIGVLATPLAWLTLGEVRPLTNLSLRGLQLPAIVLDLVGGVPKIIDPAGI